MTTTAVATQEFRLELKDPAFAVNPDQLELIPGLPHTQPIISTVVFRYEPPSEGLLPWLVVIPQGNCTPPLEHWHYAPDVDANGQPYFDNTEIQLEDDLTEGRKLWKELLAYGYTRAAA